MDFSSIASAALFQPMDYSALQKSIYEPPEEHADEAFKLLDLAGYGVIDTIGDGNCGPFSFILGLVKLGKLQLPPPPGYEEMIQFRQAVRTFIEDLGPSLVTDNVDNISLYSIDMRSPESLAEMLDGIYSKEAVYTGDGLRDHPEFHFAPLFTSMAIAMWSKTQIILVSVIISDRNTEACYNVFDYRSYDGTTKLPDLPTASYSLEDLNSFFYAADTFVVLFQREYVGDNVSGHFSLVTPRQPGWIYNNPAFPVPTLTDNPLGGIKNEDMPPHYARLLTSAKSSIFAPLVLGLRLLGDITFPTTEATKAERQLRWHLRNRFSALTDQEKNFLLTKWCNSEEETTFLDKLYSTFTDYKNLTLTEIEKISLPPLSIGLLTSLWTGYKIQLITHRVDMATLQWSNTIFFGKSPTDKRNVKNRLSGSRPELDTTARLILLISQSEKSAQNGIELVQRFIPPPDCTMELLHIDAPRQRPQELDLPPTLTHEKLHDKAVTSLLEPYKTRKHLITFPAPDQPISRTIITALISLGRIFTDEINDSHLAMVRYCLRRHMIITTDSMWILENTNNDKCRVCFELGPPLHHIPHRVYSPEIDDTLPHKPPPNFDPALPIMLLLLASWTHTFIRWRFIDHKGDYSALDIDGTSCSSSIRFDGHVKLHKQPPTSEPPLSPNVVIEILSFVLEGETRVGLLTPVATSQSESSLQPDWGSIDATSDLPPLSTTELTTVLPLQKAPSVKPWVRFFNEGFLVFLHPPTKDGLVKVLLSALGHLRRIPPHPIGTRQVQGFSKHLRKFADSLETTLYDESKTNLRLQPLNLKNREDVEERLKTIFNTTTQSIGYPSIHSLHLMLALVSWITRTNILLYLHQHHWTTWHFLNTQQDGSDRFKGDIVHHEQFYRLPDRDLIPARTIEIAAVANMDSRLHFGLVCRDSSDDGILRRIASAYARRSGSHLKRIRSAAVEEAHRYLNQQSLWLNKPDGYPDFVSIKRYLSANGTVKYRVRLADSHRTISATEAQTMLHPKTIKLMESCPTILWNQPLGDALDNDPPPRHIRSRIRSKYQQLDNPYCLGYSMANALNYCGFHEASNVVAERAQSFANVPWDAAIPRLHQLLRVICPVIARPTFFNLRTAKGVTRPLSMETLIRNKTPFPTLVIPVGESGSTTHAVCVVDGLVFDAITDRALHLSQSAFNWIFNHPVTQIHSAYRFMTKDSATGRVKENYKRPIRVHPIPQRLLQEEPYLI